MRISAFTNVKFKFSQRERSNGLLLFYNHTVIQCNLNKYYAETNVCFYKAIGVSVISVLYIETTLLKKFLVPDSNHEEKVSKFFWRFLHDLEKNLEHPAVSK